MNSAVCHVGYDSSRNELWIMNEHVINILSTTLGFTQSFILQIEVQEGTFMGYMGYNEWGKWAIRTISCNIPQHSPTNNTLRATFPATDRRPPATVNCSTLLSGRTLPPSTRFWFGCRPPSYCLLTRLPGPTHVL